MTALLESMNTICARFVEHPTAGDLARIAARLGPLAAMCAKGPNADDALDVWAKMLDAAAAQRPFLRQALTGAIPAARKAAVECLFAVDYVEALAMERTTSQGPGLPEPKTRQLLLFQRVVPPRVEPAPTRFCYPTLALLAALHITGDLPILFVIDTLVAQTEDMVLEGPLRDLLLDSLETALNDSATSHDALGLLAGITPPPVERIGTILAAWLHYDDPGLASALVNELLSALAITNPAAAEEHIRELWQQVTSPAGEVPSAAVNIFEDIVRDSVVFFGSAYSVASRAKALHVLAARRSQYDDLEAFNEGLKNRVIKHFDYLADDPNRVKLPFYEFDLAMRRFGPVPLLHHFPSLNRPHQVLFLKQAWRFASCDEARSWSLIGFGHVRGFATTSVGTAPQFGLEQAVRQALGDVAPSDVPVIHLAAKYAAQQIGGYVSIGMLPTGIGSPDPLLAIVDDLMSIFRGIARRTRVSDYDFDDVLSEFKLKLIRNRKTLSKTIILDPKAFLIVSFRRFLENWLRSRGRRSRLVGEMPHVLDEENGKEVPLDVAARDSDRTLSARVPEDVTIDPTVIRQLLSKYPQRLANLTALQRAAVVLWTYQFPYKDITASTGLSTTGIGETLQALNPEGLRKRAKPK